MDVDNSLIILKHINSKNTKIRVIIRPNMKHVWGFYEIVKCLSEKP